MVKEALASITDRRPHSGDSDTLQREGGCYEGRGGRPTPGSRCVCAQCLGVTSSIALKPALNRLLAITAIPQTAAGLEKQLQNHSLLPRRRCHLPHVTVPGVPPASSHKQFSLYHTGKVGGPDAVAIFIERPSRSGLMALSTPVNND